ncbi:RDD family protein [bacterium]|nr:RDD family protein [bacterium]MDB4259587.1 RDD family protein [Akkermansiaceae bacterium]MDB4307402.1 RDD family protein [Akkermansiaceae bacterium]MDB4319548.1 RDD family protein [bacterium]MDB4692025.1 RDD family protein [Akkermansiaceae bacterium]
MKIWIIEDGEKKGPLEDYEVREQIRSGELRGETQCWYEGAPGWLPANEVHFFETEFEDKAPVILVPPPLPVKMNSAMLWRRLGARWFDIGLYSCLILFVMRLGDIRMMATPENPVSGWVSLAHFVPAIIFEGVFLHLWGASPGKMFLRLRVEDKDGKNLGLGAALMRSMRVWVLGVGMRMPILTLLGHGIALWMVRKRGAPLWDLVTGYRVPGQSLTGLRLGLFVAVLIVFWVLFFVIIWPEFGPLVMKSFEEAKAASSPAS